RVGFSSGGFPSGGFSTDGKTVCGVILHERIFRLWFYQVFLGEFVDDRLHVRKAAGLLIAHTTAFNITFGFEFFENAFHRVTTVGSSFFEVCNNYCPIVRLREEIGEHALGLPTEVGIIERSVVDHHEGIRLLARADDVFRFALLHEKIPPTREESPGVWYNSNDIRLYGDSGVCGLMSWRTAANAPADF